MRPEEMNGGIPMAQHTQGPAGTAVVAAPLVRPPLLTRWVPLRLKQRHLKGCTRRLRPEHVCCLHHVLRWR